MHGALRTQFISKDSMLGSNAYSRPLLEDNRQCGNGSGRRALADRASSVECRRWTVRLDGGDLKS